MYYHKGLETRVKFSHFKERCSRYNLILSSFYGKKWIFPNKRPFFQRSSRVIGLENYNREKNFYLISRQIGQF